MAEQKGLLMKKSSPENKIVSGLFCVAIIISCIGMLYALGAFVYNCNYVSYSINNLINNYSSTLPSNIQTQVNIDNDVYVEKLIEYAMRLQELEANSISTNILTFLYTFLSGTLIGVATYFTKKSYDSIKQIKENKELLINLDERTLYSSLYIYIQRTHSIMQVFCVSLDAIQDNDALNTFIDRSVPRLNDAINEMTTFFTNRKNEIRILSSDQKNHLIKEINEVGNLIHTINIPQHSFITDDTKNLWHKQLKEIKNLIKQ